jgi:hypothetical protein
VKRLAAALALSAGVLLSGCPEPGIVDARVTNCWHYDSYSWTQGKCGGKDANPPYTTQWALMLPCSNGTVTSGWRNAGAQAAVVQCIGSGRRVAPAYFLFR